MEQEKLLRKITSILEKLAIPYIVTGGIAVVVWGRPRFTADIDIVVELVPEKLDDLAQALLKVDKGVFVDEDTMRQALVDKEHLVSRFARNKGEFNFLHPTSGLKVDFWVMKGNLFDKERLRRRIKKNVFGQDIFFVTPEDLILKKLLWYKEGKSTRQLEDIESILRIQKNLDIAYLTKWAKEHSTLDVLLKLMKEQGNHKKSKVKMKKAKLQGKS